MKLLFLIQSAIIRKFNKGIGTPPKVQITKFKKQKGSTDCGLFAIAVVTALVFGQEPFTLKFIQEKIDHTFSPVSMRKR